MKILQDPNVCRDQNVIKLYRLLDWTAGNRYELSRNQQRQLIPVST